MFKEVQQQAHGIRARETPLTSNRTPQNGEGIKGVQEFAQASQFSYIGMLINL